MKKLERKTRCKTRQLRTTMGGYETRDRTDRHAGGLAAAETKTFH